jgi:hypothetical protein
MDVGIDVLTCCPSLQQHPFYLPLDKKLKAGRQRKVTTNIFFPGWRRSMSALGRDAT